MLPACEKLEVGDGFRRVFGEDRLFERVMQLEGEVFRDVPGRRTLQFALGGHSYFAKLHFGVGWREIFKNLVTLRLPVVSAMTEWRAIERLNALGVPTTPAVAFGRRGCNPAGMQSFIITEDLGGIVSLEDFCRDWPDRPPPLSLKRNILHGVAQIARTIHEHGLNHRDFYICHLCLDSARLAAGEVLLYLIDLHRVQIRAKTPASWRMKDLAALYFSALDIGLSRRDCLRFLRRYRGMPLRHIFAEETRFWSQVDWRARKLYYKFHQRWPRTPFDAEL